MELIENPATGTTQTTDTGAAAGPVMTSRQRAVLVLLLGAQFMLAVDFSILNVALPSISSHLGFRAADLQWVATAFALPAAGCTLLAGRVGDRIGRRRTFMAGMAVLVVGAFVGGAANTPGTLLTARVLQGLATAIATPAALALLAGAFEEGPLRQKAMGLNGALMAGGFTTGAVFGGLLTDMLSWRWAFFVNIPLGLAILAAAPALLTESRARAERLDLPGAVTVTGGLLLAVYGVNSGARIGWANATTISTLILGAILLAAFWRIEATAADPLVSLPMLRRGDVRYGNLGGFTIFVTASAATFLMTLFIQQVLGYSPLSTGLLFGAMGAGAFVGGILAAQLVVRTGPKRLLVGGLGLQGLATAGFVLVGDQRGGGAVTALLVVGIVWGLAQVVAIVAYMVTATAALPPESQGQGTALTTMTQQVALTIGIPLLSTLAVSRTNALRHTGTALHALVGGIRLALVVDGALLLVSTLVIALALKTRTQSE